MEESFWRETDFSSSMEYTDAVFALQHRIADCSSDITVEEYWSLYDQFASAATRGELKLLSLMDLHSSLLKRIMLKDRVVFQRQGCPVETFILNGLKEVRAQLEYCKHASAVISMLEHYYRLFWLSSSLIDVVMQILSVVMQWTTLNSNGLAAVLVLLQFHM